MLLQSAVPDKKAESMCDTWHTQEITRASIQTTLNCPPLEPPQADCQLQVSKGHLSPGTTAASMAELRP